MTLNVSKLSSKNNKSKNMTSNSLSFDTETSFNSLFVIRKQQSDSCMYKRAL